MVKQTEGVSSPDNQIGMPFEFVSGLMDDAPAKVAEPIILKPMTPVTSVTE